MASSGARGFTLIEVVFAIGIAATVLIGLVALVPFGTSTMREAMNNTIESRIMQQLTSELQTTDWGIDENYRAELTDKLQEQIRYYDDQGTEMAVPGEHIYTARVLLSTDGAELPGSEPHLPAYSGRTRRPSKKNPFLRRLTLEITNIPDVDVEFFEDPENRSRFRRVTTSVVSMHPIKE